MPFERFLLLLCFVQHIVVLLAHNPLDVAKAKDLNCYYDISADQCVTPGTQYGRIHQDLIIERRVFDGKLNIDGLTSTVDRDDMFDNKGVMLEEEEEEEAIPTGLWEVIYKWWVNNKVYIKQLIKTILTVISFVTGFITFQKYLTMLVVYLQGGANDNESALVINQHY